jgi:6,7-dimethyl-8-ribityllumazine synthase
MNQSFLENSAAVRIAFVQARWHADIVDQCRISFVDEIEQIGRAHV